MVRLFNSQTLSLTRFLVFLLLLANIGCQKEMSKDTLGSGGTVGGGGNSSGGTAVFKLVPAGNSCSDAAVTGLIEAGTTLAADALITVTVNVTKVGDWTYSTAAADGFSFVGAGNFTATGSQVITLYGVGKPTRAGVFSFTLTIGGGSCLVPVLVATAGTGGAGGGVITPGNYYYKATIDGTSYTQTVTPASIDYESGTSISGSDDVVLGGSITWVNPPIPAGKTEFGINKGILHNYLSITKPLFKAFFTPATYPYSADYSTIDGVSVSWTDPSGVPGPNATDNVWSTDNGTKDQTGSSFKIVSATEYTDPIGNYYIIVKAQFNCNLYNGTTGAKKVLTNGEAVVAFGMF